MKRLLRLIFLAVPCACLLAFVAVSMWQRAAVQGELHDADGMCWGEGDERYTVRIESEGVEQVTVRIRILRAGDELVFDRTFHIDRDMFGGAFVNGYQADADPELELLAWSAHAPKDSFVLDHVEGVVSETPFGAAAPGTHAYVKRWRQLRVIRPMEIAIALFVGVVYYGFCGLLLLIVRFFRRRAANRAQSNAVEGNRPQSTPAEHRRRER